MPLKATVSLDARRVIKAAFQDLERALSTSDRVDLKDTTLDNVRQAAIQVQDELKARGEFRNIRRLTPLFDGLQYYSKSIEVLCNGTPYLPWIWAPIKLVLKVASDYVEAFEKIMKAYSRIAEPLARFAMFDRTYTNNKDVQQTLAIFYSDILKFHKEAYQFVRRGSWKLLFLSSWGRFQRRFDGIIEDLKAHEDLIDKTINAVDVIEAKQMRDKLDAWRKEALEKLEKEDQERTVAQFHAVVGWLKMDESVQLKIVEAIASEAEKSPGTCSWILRQPEIQSWMRDNRDNAFIVLRGRPGSGKSVLASQVINFLRSSDRSLVISHFCTYSYEESLDYEKILRSVLIQLIRLNADLVAHVYEVLILKKKLPSSQVLEGLLRVIFEAGSEQHYVIHLILDGIDECPKATQTKVVKMLERAVSASSSSDSTVCKVLLLGRDSVAATGKGKAKKTVSLSDEKSNLTEAIECYAAQRLGSLLPRFSEMKIDNEDIKILGRRIATKADGMFLWARLVLEYLDRNFFFIREEVLGAADALPQELKDFYRQILSRVTSGRNNLTTHRIKLMLGWIAFAERPLRKAEFRSALAFSSGDRDVKELVPSYLFDECKPLIEERRDSTFAFIHVSVKEYLQSPGSIMFLKQHDVICEHGTAAITCLLSGLQVYKPSFSKDLRLLRTLSGIHGFHAYATEHWLDYVLAITELPEDSAKKQEFFHLSVEFAKLLKPKGVGNHGEESGASDSRLIHLKSHSAELYRLAVETSLMRRTRYLPECAQEDVSSNLVDDITNLTALLENYQLTIQQPPPDLTIDAVSSVVRPLPALQSHLPDVDSSTPVSQPTSDLVGTDFEAGLERNTPLPGCDSGYMSFKQHMNFPDLAKTRSDIGLVSRDDSMKTSSRLSNIMVDDADLSLHSQSKGKVRTPLMQACIDKDYEAAEQALRPENMNLADFTDSTPLQYAATMLDFKMIVLLIAAGYDLSDFGDMSAVRSIQLRSMQLGTLRSAAGRGELESVEHILGVLRLSDDPESLVAAAMGGHIEVIQLLLNRGANPDPPPIPSETPEFSTPMLAAIGKGYIEVIMLLVMCSSSRHARPGMRRKFGGEFYFEIAERRKGPRWEDEFSILKQAYLVQGEQ
ncbi:hypothetical protein FZEAL_89 [Fusarium zealandicum]|uniref:NACHT domain-containing protein n=1 Tax=Fusarium zealandicum TaxID=1053134 RepID=A0A8H4UVK0_9HYPO|nr:hypothetical protein FZEAL_89 [Fusarium zealandicum]